MNKVTSAIKKAEKLLPGIPTPEGKVDPRWLAIIEIGEYLETDPQEIWPFIRKWGAHPNEDLRIAIGTLLLEPLLELHFEEFFPLVRQACKESKEFAFTFEMSDFAITEQGDNLKAFIQLKKELDQEFIE